MISKVKSNKGFTLIELIVVIAVIGILVLLAAPKLLGYTQDARMSQIKADIKANEDMVETARVNNAELFDSWGQVGLEELKEFSGERRLFDKNGLVTDTLKLERELSNNNFKMPAKDINSKLNGDFFIGEGGKAFYYNGHSGWITSSGLGGEEWEDEEIYPNQDFTPEEIRLACEGYEDNMATNADFRGLEDGKFRYAGEDTTVCIPHVIKDQDVTSIKAMFKGTKVDKVVSRNPNITDMSYAFDRSRARSLDLSDFNSSNVYNLIATFQYSRIEVIDFEGFDTSNVTQMGSTFLFTPLVTLDVTGFDTSKVENNGSTFFGTRMTSLDLSNWSTESSTFLGGMFEQSSMLELDLSNFDISNVNYMAHMFDNSKAKTLDLSTWDMSKEMVYKGQLFNNSSATTVYARSEADILQFKSNGSEFPGFYGPDTAYPDTMNFIVK